MREQPRQEIRFCRAPDGVRIAYAVHGTGPPMVVDSCWLSHLQYDWQSPVWRHYLEEWGRTNTVIRFDERGHGLSDRDVTDHSLEARLGDLEAVVDDAGLDRFALQAMAQGGPVAIAYVAKHPERVSRLVFYGSYACGMSDDPEEAAAQRHLRPADQGRLGATRLRLPPGVHLADDPAGHRGAARLARRAPARVHLRRDRADLKAAATPGRQLAPCWAASTCPPWSSTRAATG